MNRSKIFYLLILALIIALIYIIYYKQGTSVNEIAQKNDYRVTIYSKKACSFCNKAKELLHKKWVSYKEIDITENQKLYDQLYNETNQSTVPYIFINEKFIGGYQELAEAQNLFNR